MTPRSGCRGREGSCPIPSPKTESREDPQPCDSSTQPQISSWQRGAWIRDQHPREGWGQLPCLWQHSQVPSRTMGARGWWVKQGAVAAC